MKLVKSYSCYYVITERDKEILKEYDSLLTISELRNLPEFIFTQINVTKDDYVYVLDLLLASSINIIFLYYVRLIIS